tara:strand:- start:30281 stop:31993 length:1713 start_codon:yes stop_codon:yes gene_type:complete
MSANFIKNKVGSEGLADAVTQQKQLSYFTKGEIQENITHEYLEAWANRNYSTNNHFLNFIKNVFKTDNFLSFYKYLRNPVASSGLINDKIKNPLSRVFFAEDSYFKYTIKGETYENIDELDSEDFNEKLFNALLFEHNNIVVTNLSDVNKPYREIIDIERVISIESDDSVISRIAYSAEYDGKKGYLYLDANSYTFFNSEFKEVVTVNHDLGLCPADYISKHAYDDEVVRMSMFTFLREKLEEYVFLKTLQRMTEPNGAIPIVTKLDAKDKSARNDIEGSSDKQPMSSNIAGQRAKMGRGVNGKGSPLQAGTIIDVPIIKKDDGSIDMNAVQNFLNFFYVPVESLNYLRDRIKEIEIDIITSALGDYSEAQESAKNQMQVSKSYVSKQDKLRALSMELTRIRKLSDYKFLALQYGKDVVSVECFYGSDFFLESQMDIYNMFEKNTNPIERKNLLIRLTRNKNRFNKDKMEREVLLYNLLPYCSDKDFDKAIDRGLLNTTIFEYQTRFSYWIGMFEATYGDILEFYNSFDQTKSERIILINNLITQIIKTNEQENKPNSVLTLDKGATSVV